jgi:hypothetical protein
MSRSIAITEWAFRRVKITENYPGKSYATKLCHDRKCIAFVIQICYTAVKAL